MANMCSMGEAGHVTSKFSRALERGNYRSALMLAYEVPRVSLQDAAALTLLAAEHEPEAFEPMARRWMRRLLEEASPPVKDLAIAAVLLDDVRACRLPPSKALDPLQRMTEGRPLG
jgi:hypothetical protein